MSTRAQIRQRQPTRTSLTRVPSGLLQRACACGAHTGGGQCETCNQQASTLQRQAGHHGEPSQVPRSVHEVLRSPGQPLDHATRAFMEPRLGHDLSHVRVHADAKAAQSAGDVNALAYTLGPNVVFGAGQYAPSTAAGKTLLAHELTHTLQQSAGAPSAELSIGDPSSPWEEQAAAVSAGIHRGATVTALPVRRNVLQRAPAAPAKGTTPADFGIALVVVDHGATGAAGSARARLQEIYSHLRPANLAQLQSIGITRVEMHIIPEDTKLTDLPEFKRLRGTKTPDGRLWDNVRGAGGQQEGSVIRYAVAEEDLIGSKKHGAAIGFGIAGSLLIGAAGAGIGIAAGSGGSPQGRSGRELAGGLIGGALGLIAGAVGGALLGSKLDQDTGYARNFTASHEASHTVELFALTPAQRAKLEKLYAARLKAGGLWLAPESYTKSNIHEYWAQCASAFFRKPYTESDKDSYTPEWLRKNDPGMFELLNEVFGSGEMAKHGGLESAPAEKAAA